MNIVIKAPDSPQVRQVVNKFWVVEDLEAKGLSPQKVIPFGSFELIFHLSNSFVQSFDNENWMVQPKILLTGHYEKCVTIRPLGAYRSLGISLHPWCGNLFCRFSLTEITSLFSDGINLNKDLLFTYHQKFQSTQDNQELFNLAEQMILLQLNGYQENDLVKRILHSIAADPCKDLKTIFNDYPYTTRRIEQIFKNQVGISASFFRKKIRFQQALKLAKKSPELSLTQIALDAGYYDQANFIKTFRQFTNVTPKAFMNDPASRFTDLI